MGVVVVYPVPYTPTTEASFSRIKEMIPVVTCPAFITPPFIGDSVALGYNCNRCASDAKYYNLYKFNDIIPFQAFAGDSANANPTTPTIGFKDTGSGITAGTDYYVKIELLDGVDCLNVVTDNADDFCSDYWVSFDPEVGSIQTFFVDTSTFPSTRTFFRVKITTYNSAGGVVIESYTEPFQLADCVEPYTVLMEGHHAIEDCLRRRYTVDPNNVVGPSTPPVGSPTPYYTSWRFPGELIHTGHTQEPERNDNDVILTNKIRKTFNLNIRKLPPYAEEILATITTANQVMMDADGSGLQLYEEFSDISKGIDVGTRMFLPRLTCTQICEIDGFECE